MIPKYNEKVVLNDGDLHFVNFLLFICLSEVIFIACLSNKILPAFGGGGNPISYPIIRVMGMGIRGHRDRCHFFWEDLIFAALNPTLKNTENGKNEAKISSEFWNRKLPLILAAFFVIFGGT